MIDIYSTPTSILLLLGNAALMIVANTIALFLWMYFFNKWKMMQQIALI